VNLCFQFSASPQKLNWPTLVGFLGQLAFASFPLCQVAKQPSSQNSQAAKAAKTAKQRKQEQGLVKVGQNRWRRHCR